MSLQPRGLEERPSQVLALWLCLSQSFPDPAGGRYRPGYLALKHKVKSLFSFSIFFQHKTTTKSLMPICLRHLACNCCLSLGTLKNNVKERVVQLGGDTGWSKSCESDKQVIQVGELGQGLSYPARGGQGQGQVEPLIGRSSSTRAWARLPPGGGEGGETGSS